MKLKEINKKLYRNHLRIVFIGIVFILLGISVSTSTVFIHLFSEPEVSHFIYNLLGVIFAAIIVYMVLNKFRQHSFMLEVVYVWDLKQQLNRINRKLRKIEAAVEKNDKDAMVIMSFLYRASKQLYELDDNTITMDSLISKANVLEQRMKNNGLSMATSNYEQSMLEKF